MLPARMTERLPNPALREQLQATGKTGEAAYAELQAAELEVGRSCGDCTVCCHVCGVPELDNPPGTACAHVCAKGCEIYADRPGGCRVYACAWKLGFGPDAERPDRVGGLLEWHELDPGFHPMDGHWIFRLEADEPTREGEDLVDALLANGCLVLLYRGPSQPLTMIYPDGSADEEAGVATSWDEEQAGDSMEYRVAYWDSYADALDPELRAAVEGGLSPFEG